MYLLRRKLVNVYYSLQFAVHEAKQHKHEVLGFFFKLEHEVPVDIRSKSQTLGHLKFQPFTLYRRSQTKVFTEVLVTRQAAASWEQHQMHSE